MRRQSMKIPVGLRLSPEIIKLYKEIAKKNKWSINTCIEEAVKLLHDKEINIVKKK
jgi:predicted HicB family RNase H-like nuclease